MKNDKLFRDSRCLPMGNIKPAGWLKDWLQVSADGWLLDYALQKHDNVWNKFWCRNKTSEVLFDENNQTLILADYTGYMVDAMMRHVVMLPDCKLRKEAEEWVEKCLQSQDDDGYIGAFEKPHRYKHWLDMFATCWVLEGLLYWGNTTGDGRVLTAVKRAFDNITDAWYAPDTNIGVFGNHGVVYIRLASKMYEQFGDKRYIEVSENVINKFGWQADFLPEDSGEAASDPMEMDYDPLYRKHLVIASEMVSIPSVMYELNGDEYMLRASEAGFDFMSKHHLTVTGTPLGNELLLNQGPRLGSEHCGTVDWVIACLEMGRITGNVRYFDAAEKALYNAYPAAKTVDQRMVAYTHCTNELVASEWSVPHTYNPTDWWASRAYFHTSQEPLCCNANSGRAIPLFIEHMVLATDAGFRFAAYGPCCVNVEKDGVRGTVTAETEYPNEDTIKYSIKLEKKIQLKLEFRVPLWSDGCTVTYNGKAYKGTPGAFLAIEGEFENDELTVEFENHIKLTEWDRAEFNMRPKAVVVSRGALVFALHPQETWTKITPPASAPVQEKQYVEAYRIIAENGSGWNKAIYADFENPESCMEFVRLDAPDGKPFEYAKVGIKVKGRTVKDWVLEGPKREPMTPQLPLLPLEYTTEDEEIILEPFGCTRLRMTYIPLING